MVLRVVAAGPRVHSLFLFPLPVIDLGGAPMGVLRKPVVLKRGGRVVKLTTPSEITAYKAAGYAVVEDAPKPAQDKPAQAKPDGKKN